MVAHKLAFVEPVVFTDVNPAVVCLMVAAPDILVVKAQRPFAEAETLFVVSLKILLESAFYIVFVGKLRRFFLISEAFQRLQADKLKRCLQHQYQKERYGYESQYVGESLHCQLESEIDERAETCGVECAKAEE